MNDKRPFANIPRQFITIAAVIGGMIGIVLSDRLGWDDLQGFLYTLIICMGCVFITVIIYSAVTRNRTKSQ